MDLRECLLSKPLTIVTPDENDMTEGQTTPTIELEVCREDSTKPFLVSTSLNEKLLCDISKEQDDTPTENQHRLLSIFLRLLNVISFTIVQLFAKILFVR